MCSRAERKRRRRAAYPRVVEKEGEWIVYAPRAPLPRALVLAINTPGGSISGSFPISYRTQCVLGLPWRPAAQ